MSLCREKKSCPMHQIQALWWSWTSCVQCFDCENDPLVSKGLIDQDINFPSLAEEPATEAVLLWGLEPVALLSWVWSATEVQTVNIILALILNYSCNLPERVVTHKAFLPIRAISTILSRDAMPVADASLSNFTVSGVGLSMIMSIFKYNLIIMG